MLFLLFSVFTVSEIKISHLNALLRFKDQNSARNPHFTLSAEGGCMNFTSLNENIVKVYPNYESGRCSKSARVEAVATGPNRKSTSIIIEDSTGQSAKCDVFVDSVASVSILTTTRSIYIESSLETLYLQALDSGKNIFTSLEGTDIDWKIDTDHLRIIDPSKAKITQASSSSTSHPKSSARLIVQGTKVGKTWASATLDNNLHSEVDLTVVEPISLFPQPIVRVLPYTHIPYKLCSTRGSNTNEGERQCATRIHLPDEQNYRIEISNNDLFSTDQSAYVTVNGVGSATITAIDQHMSDNTASSLIIASYPSRWIQDEQYIALGDNPTFHPKIFDRDNKEYDYFEEVNWEIIGDWSTIGRKEVTLKYHDFTFIAIVHVCPPLAVSPQKALLPINYKGFPLIVTNGSGTFTYKVENPSILKYSNGKVDTYNYGISRIIFRDSKIEKFTVTAEIEVSRIGLIDIQLENRETIDTPFQPVCDVFATEKRRFSVNMPYKVQSSDLNVVLNNMIPNSPGFADIYCQCGESQSEHLKVSVASKLKAEVDGIASPNSIVPLKISGGVRRWPMADEGPTIKINCPDTISKVYDNNQFSIDREFSGVCTVSMQNKQTSQNPHPLLVEAKLELKIHKVDRFTMHFIDFSNQNYVDSRCNFPPLRVADAKTSKNHYNISLNRQYKIYVYAIDAYNDLIKYYSADRFTIQSSTLQEIIPNSRQRDLETDLSTQFLITPTQPTKLTLVPANAGTKSDPLNLNAISDFSIKGSNLLYFHSGRNYQYTIDGGSGIFETKHPNAYIRESQLYLSTNSPGNYRIDVKDVCNPNYYKDVEVDLISVASLRIEAPTLVAFNTEFEAVVKALDKDGQVIPQSMYEEANIHLSNPDAKKVNYNTWRLNATTGDKMTITAIAENGVSAEHVVNIVQSIIVSPQYIELLPGETQRVSVTCGPSNINFDDGHSRIATFNTQTYEVVAITPGRVVINVTARDIEGLPSFPIYVHVIRPIDLKITPSSDHVVQTGKLMLSVLMNTDVGVRFINNAKWNIPSDFTYDMINNSLIVIQCSEAKNLMVSVSAYGLSASYSTEIEPKLKLLSPQEIYLPTHCSYKILVENDLNCEYSSLDTSIATLNQNGKGIIESNDIEGDAIIMVKFGHQFLTLNVKVSNPKQFYINQAQSSTLDYEFVVLNPEGLQYTTTKCLKYDLSVLGKDSVTAYTAKEIQSQNGRILSIATQASFDHPIEVVASISNQKFNLKNNFRIASSHSITPEKPVFLKGYGKLLQCSVQNPNWFVSDSSIASVTSKGFVNARKVGITQISCGNGISTTLKVLEIKNIKVQQEPSNSNDKSIDYKVDFILSDSSLMSNYKDIIKPDDLAIKCDLDVNSQVNGCGHVSYINKNGHDYCVFQPSETNICHHKAKVIATASSPSIGIHFKGESPIPVSKTESDEEYSANPSKQTAKKTYVTVSKEKRTVEVPVNMKSDTTIIRPSYGLTAEFSTYGDIVVVTAEDDFGSSGTVSLHDQVTGEKYIIEVSNDTPTNSRRSMFKAREFSFTGNEMIYATGILILMGLAYFAAYLYSIHFN